MVAQKGREFLIKIAHTASPTVFSTIGGATSGTISNQNGTLDITNKDSAGVRQLLSGQYSKFSTVTLQGVFIDDTYINQARTDALAGTERDYQIVIPGGGTYEGPFVITTFEESGETDGAVLYSITLESTDAITFT